MKPIFVLLMLIASTISLAQSSRVINVFYDGRTQEFTVNTEKASGRSGFIRTKKIVLITNRVSICKKGCIADIKGVSYTSFAINVAGHKIATVTTNDSDNLLTSEAFDVLSVQGKDQLVLDLNKLENGSQADVK